MALAVALEFVGFDFRDRPFVDVAGGEFSGCDELPEPGRCERVDFVVVDSNVSAPSAMCNSTQKTERRDIPSVPLPGVRSSVENRLPALRNSSAGHSGDSTSVAGHGMRIFRL